MRQGDGRFALGGFGSLAASAGHFVRHFLEMCAAMCLGSALLTPLFVRAAASIGYPDPLVQMPELSVFVIAFNMTAPMAAWMRYRGMDWSSISEMSGVMVAEAVLLIGAFWLGVIPQSSLLALQHTLMMPAMLVPMLYRRHIYMGHASHRAHAA